MSKNPKEAFKNPYRWLRKTAKEVSKKYGVEECRVIIMLLTALYSGRKVYIAIKKGDI